MLTISKEQQKFIDEIILGNYFDYLGEESILSSEDFKKRQLEGFHKLDSSEELQYLMEWWNWDDGNEIPNLVLNHPKCDYGTALMVYWMFDPSEYTMYDNEKNVPDFLLEDYKMLKELEHRLVAGEFVLSRIKYNPSLPQHSTPKALENPSIPEKLKKESNGDDFNVS